MLRIELNDSEKSSLRLLARQEVGRVSERIHFIMMAAMGMSAPEIGTVMGYDPNSVRTWLNRFAVDGVTGLQDQPRSGRPCKQRHLDSMVEAQISQPPDVNGYIQSVWTVALMVLHLATRFRTVVSTSTVRRALHHIRFTWKRPKLAPARRADPDRVAKQTRLAAVLANLDPLVNLVAVDECDCHLLALVRSMWQRIGLAGQKRLPTPGQNQHRSVFGSLNLRTGLWHYCVRTRKCTADFIVLLSMLLSAYPVGTIYVIADNCKIHCSKALAAWLVLHPRIQMVYLPTYSAHLLNPVT
jgi:transposase